MQARQPLALLPARVVRPVAVAALFALLALLRQALLRPQAPQPRALAGQP